MSGALVALTAVGAHNRYTTAAPQQTLFKNAYRRHTAFSMKDEDNTFSGSVDFGQTVTATISRDADLIGPIAVDFGLPVLEPADTSSIPAWVEHIGHALVEEASFSVGGHQFDKQTSEWLEIWSQLSTPESKWAGYEYLIGERAGLVGWSGTANVDVAATVITVPLPFYFCLSPKNYFPAISTQYHELKLRLKIRAIGSVVRHQDTSGASVISGDITTTVPSLTECVVRTRYVYLTDDERRRFAYSAHEYLITQIQEVASQSVSQNSTETVSLNANHLVSAFYFVIRGVTAASQNMWFNFTDTAGVTTIADRGSLYTTRDAMLGSNPISTMRITLNGSDVMNDAKEGDYFKVYQPYLHHTRVPQNTSAGINMYSFALNAESITSTGTCNASRIDRIQAVITTATTITGGSGTLLVYARSFNIARHINGLAGIAYSN